MAVPSVMHVSNTSVTLKFNGPTQNTQDEFSRIIYMIQFRKFHSRIWIGIWDIYCGLETIHNLDASSLYTFGVAAKYDGGDYGPYSDLVHVKTGPAVTGKSCSVFVLKAQRYAHNNVLFGIPCIPSC